MEIYLIYLLTIFTLGVITITNLFLNIFYKVRPVGPMCSKHSNLNTTSGFPGIWALLSLDSMVVGSEVEGGDGDGTTGGTFRC